MMIHADGFQVTQAKRLTRDDGSEFTTQNLVAYRDGSPIATVSLYDANLASVVVGPQGDGLCPVYLNCHQNEGRQVVMERSPMSDGTTVCYAFGFDDKHGGLNRMVWVFVPRDNDAVCYREESRELATA